MTGMMTDELVPVSQGPNIQNIVQQIYDNVSTCGRFRKNVR